MPVGKLPQGRLQKAAGRAILTASTKHRQMETLSNDILALIDALESDIEVPDFDLDEVLEDA